MNLSKEEQEPHIFVDYNNKIETLLHIMNQKQANQKRIWGEYKYLN